MSPLPGIILAAGLSRRMEGKCKLLLPFRGRAMVAHAARAALDGGLNPVVLVVGPHSPSEVAQACLKEASAENGRIRVATAERAAMGQAESLKAGLTFMRKLAPDAPGVMVLLGDLPLVDGDLVVTIPVDRLAMPAGYTITTIGVLPYFASEGKEAVGELVLPDGSVVTGKTSSLLGASAALLLNALKAMAGIDHKLKLIPASVIEPISRLKTGNLGHRNPRLHSDEVLIALAISGLTNPLAAMVQEQLSSLRGCDAHFSVIISEEDEKLYKRLGINVTCQPRYEVKKLYHK